MTETATGPANEARAVGARAVGASKPGVTFWAAMVVGAALVIFGAVNLVEVQRPRLPSIGRWFVGGALVLDLLIVPVGALIGVVLRRLLPRLVWPPVRAALLASAVLIAYAAPLISNEGGRPDNASLRSRPYGSGLAWALLAVWLVAALAVVARLRHQQRRSGAVAT